VSLVILSLNANWDIFKIFCAWWRLLMLLLLYDSQFTVIIIIFINITIIILLWLTQCLTVYCGLVFILNNDSARLINNLFDWQSFQFDLLLFHLKYSNSTEWKCLTVYCGLVFILNNDNGRLINNLFDWQSFQFDLLLFHLKYSKIILNEFDVGITENGF